MEGTSEERSQRSSISSDKDTGSVAASSKYSNGSDKVSYSDEAIPENSNIIKRPSMYYSENNKTSRRQSLLSKRSQLLHQVEELKSFDSSTPKFVVTNPDIDETEDLKDFVSLMKVKGQKLTAEDLQQLKIMGKQPAFNRASMMSQYSGVVEEVAEVQQILPDRSKNIPSLVEVASTVHKRGNSSSIESRDEHKKSKSTVESIKSLESITNLGPLPTTALQNDELSFDQTRSPDLSQYTEIDPIIPPRSSKRPQSQILVSPSTSRLDSPSLASIDSPIPTKRYSLPPPKSELPLTPSQIKELKESGTSSYSTPPKLDYAKILQETTIKKDRKRIPSLNRPLPEPPLSEDDNDDDEEEEEKEDDGKAHSEKLLLADSLSRKEVITDEELLGGDAMEVVSPVEREVKGYSLREGNVLSPIGSESGVETDRLDELLPIVAPPNPSYKIESKAFSVASLTTDNASFHTANDDDEREDREEDYEDIEEIKPAKRTGRKHKKKSSTQSLNKLRPFSISTLSKLLESTDGVIIGEEFNSLDISNDEKKYIEKIVDVVARLTADMVLDPSRHDGTINRMKAALRILEGFE